MECFLKLNRGLVLHEPTDTDVANYVEKMAKQANLVLGDSKQFQELASELRIEIRRSVILHKTAHKALDLAKNNLEARNRDIDELCVIGHPRHNPILTKALGDNIDSLLDKSKFEMDVRTSESQIHNTNHLLPLELQDGHLDLEKPNKSKTKKSRRSS